MKAYIITTFLGVFGVDENNKIVGFVPFKKDAKEIARKLKESDLKVIDEEKKLQTQLWRKGFKEFVYPINKQDVKHVEENSKAENYIKENLLQIALERKIVKDEEEFNNLFREVSVELTKVQIKISAKRDSLVVQAVRALDEIDKVLNVFSERLREWYGLHFPELNRAVASHEKFAKLVAKYGKRENVEGYEKLAEESIGIEINEEDEKILKEYASFLEKLFDLREKLEKYVVATMKEMAPNFSEIAGPLLAARILSKAGSLEKLAKAPSSLIQLIGAEKSLFRYLHGKGKAPKHGLIYLHPYIQNAKKEDRGKVARILANKISLAVRIDYYTKDDKREELKRDLEEKLKEILNNKNG
jgi:nucleolar protein 56